MKRENRFYERGFAQETREIENGRGIRGLILPKTSFLMDNKWIVEHLV